MISEKDFLLTAIDAGLKRNGNCEFFIPCINQFFGWKIVRESDSYGCEMVVIVKGRVHIKLLKQIANETKKTLKELGIATNFNTDLSRYGDEGFLEDIEIDNASAFDLFLTHTKKFFKL